MKNSNLFLQMILVIVLVHPAAAMCPPPGMFSSSYISGENSALSEIHRFLGKEHRVVASPEHESRVLTYKVKNDGRRTVLKTSAAALIVHGLFNSPKYMGNLQKLSYDSGHNVINFRLPGHFENDRRTLDRVMYDDWINQTLTAFEWAKQLGQKVILIGHSTGALLVAYLAALYPDVVERTVLFAPPFDLVTKVDIQTMVLARLGPVGGMIANMEASNRYMSPQAGLQVLKMIDFLKMLPFDGSSSRASVPWDFLVRRLAGQKILWIETESDQTIVLNTGEKLRDRISEAAGEHDHLRYYVIPRENGATHAGMTQPTYSGSFQIEVIIRKFLRREEINPQ